MSVLFIDGLDFGAQPHITGVVTPFAPSCKYISYNRIGAQIGAGLVVSPPFAGVQNSLQFINVGFGVQTYTKILGTRSAWCVGFARNILDVTNPSTCLFRYEAGVATTPGPSGGDNAGTSLMVAVMSADNTISVYTGPQGINGAPGALLWNSAGSYVFPLRTAVYVEVQIDTSTGTWALYINDVLIQTQTGVSLPIGVDRWSILSQGFESNFIDDLYCTDGERLGPCRVTGFAPNFGSTHEWTPLFAPNLSQIQEFGNRPGLNTPDDNQSFVSATNAGVTDYYGFAGPVCYGRILALALNADGSAIAGNPSVNFLMKLAGTEYAAGFSDAYIGGYTIRQAVSQLNPLTGIFWTDGDIAAGLFGFRMAGVGGELRITQFMMEKLVSLRTVPFTCGQGSYSYVT